MMIYRPNGVVGLIYTCYGYTMADGRQWNIMIQAKEGLSLDKGTTVSVVRKPFLYLNGL
jgi:hypothetical protein